MKNEKNFWRKTLALVLVVCLLATSGIIVSVQGMDATSGSAGAKINLTGSEKYQYDLDMPYRWDYIDDTLITNDKVSFKGYQGQGEIYITAKNGLQQVRMFVNGVEIDTSMAIENPGKTYAVDISSMTKNGSDNTIQVADFSSQTNLGVSSPTLNIKIPYPKVILGEARDVGIDQEMLDLIDTMVEKDVEYGFASAQVAVIKDGKLVKDTAYGYKNSYAQNAVTNDPKLTEKQAEAYGGKTTTDTLFDLASNSKMYSTNFAIQKLATDGVINLGDNVSKYMGDDFSDAATISYLEEHGYEASTTKIGKDTMKIEDILHHKAGFPADPQYHNNYFDPIKKQGTDDPNKNIYFTQGDKVKAKEMVSKTYLEYEPGSKNQYSDVDYMLLGMIVERATGESLDQYVKENFYDPMGLTHTTYAPKINGFEATDCAATELQGNTRSGVIKFDNVRDYTLQGEVHDEKAYYTMNQVSGHAGLYSTASELAKLCQLMISDGGCGTNSYFSKNMIDYFISPQLSNSTYGLGWRREGDNGYAAYFGVQSDSSTIGHTGWTGTLTVMDPTRDLVIVALTNKINSPLTNPSKNSNHFDGSHFTSATYGAISTMVYDAIDAYEASDVADYDTQTSATLYQMVNEKLSLYDGETSGKEFKEQTLKGAIALLDTSVTRAVDKRTVSSKEYAQKSLNLFTARSATDTMVAKYNDVFTRLQKEIDAIDSKTPIIDVSLNGYEPGTWVNSDVTVTLKNKNQQDTTYSYSVDNGVTFAKLQGNTLVVSSDTDTDYIFKATSGNYSDVSDSYSIKLEKTQPTLSLNADTSTKASRQLVSLNTTAGISGISNISVTRDGDKTDDITSNYQNGYYVTHNGDYKFTLTTAAGNTASQSLTFANISEEDPVPEPSSSSEVNGEKDGYSKGGTGARTGDETNVVPYLILCIVALCGVVTLIVKNYKKKEKSSTLDK